MYSKYHIVGSNIGKVIESDNNYFILDSDISLSVGDKLRYKADNKPVQTIEIIEKEDNKYYAKGINDNLTGLDLYRYIDVKGFKEVEESVNYRVISVQLEIEEKNNKYNIKATDEDKNSIELIYDIEKNVIPKDKIQKLLFKLDQECEFVIDDVISQKDIKIDNLELFKDKIFELLRKERAKNRPIDKVQVEKNNYPYYKKEISYLGNVTNSCTKAFYERHGVEKIEPGLETGLDLEGKKVFSSRYCLRNELDLCSKQNPKNIPPLPWTLEQIESNIKFRIEFDCSKCSMYLYLINEEK